MKTILNNPPKLFTPKRAEEVVLIMQGDDFEDFIFKAVHPDGSEYSLVEVREADTGVLISYVTTYN